MSSLFKSAIIFLCLAGCSTSNNSISGRSSNSSASNDSGSTSSATSSSGRRKSDYSGLIAQLTPTLWRRPGTWEFRVVDQQKKPMGNMVLRFTDDGVGDAACDEGEWKRAVILKDSLDYDFGFDMQPAYRVHGRWLTVDLTASMCNVDHIFNGEVDDEGASGFFNYHHRLGGNNIGAFTAVPVYE